MGKKIEEIKKTAQIQPLIDHLDDSEPQEEIKEEENASMNWQDQFNNIQSKQYLKN